MGYLTFLVPTLIMTYYSVLGGLSLIHISKLGYEVSAKFSVSVSEE